MNPELYLQYVVHRLHANSSKEVLVLREIILAMTSIDVPVDLNKDQVEAYAGGPLLRLELVCQSTRGSRSSASKRANSSGQRRLIRSLTSGQHLALPLLIALAQYRSLCSYRVQEGEWHPKYLSSVFDDVRKFAFALFSSFTPPFISHRPTRVYSNTWNCYRRHSPPRTTPRWFLLWAISAPCSAWNPQSLFSFFDLPLTSLCW